MSVYAQRRSKANSKKLDAGAGFVKAPSSLTSRTLQERADVFFAESGAWEWCDPDAVGHHDVLTLPGHPKSGLLQSPDGLLMVDTGNARHVLRGHLDFADDRTLQKVIADS